MAPGGFCCYEDLIHQDGVVIERRELCARATDTEQLDRNKIKSLVSLRRGGGGAVSRIQLDVQ